MQTYSKIREKWDITYKSNVQKHKEEEEEEEDPPHEILMLPPPPFLFFGTSHFSLTPKSPPYFSLSTFPSPSS